MNVLSLAKQMTPDEIRQNTVALARAMRCHADYLDSDFVRACDARALQGGASCEDASLYRQYSCKLLSIARDLENL